MIIADNFFSQTDQEIAARLANENEAYRRDVERHEREIAERKAVDYHANCRDCGRFVEKWRWVARSSIDAIERGRRPLCRPCWDEYD
ncbi:hypothetical protein [Metapseudomonas sp. CR1201]